MFKILCFLALDGVVINAAITLWKETGLWAEETGQFNWYLVLCVALAVWLTWELIRSIKEWLT